MYATISMMSMVITLQSVLNLFKEDRSILLIYSYGSGSGFGFGPSPLTDIFFPRPNVIKLFAAVIFECS